MRRTCKLQVTFTSISQSEFSYLRDFSQPLHWVKQMRHLSSGPKLPADIGKFVNKEGKFHKFHLFFMLQQLIQFLELSLQQCSDSPDVNNRDIFTGAQCVGHIQQPLLGQTIVAQTAGGDTMEVEWYSIFSPLTFISCEHCTHVALAYCLTCHTQLLQINTALTIKGSSMTCILLDTSRDFKCWQNIQKTLQFFITYLVTW